MGWGSSTRRGGGRKLRALPRKFVFLGFRREESGIFRNLCQDVPDPWRCSKSSCKKSSCAFFVPYQNCNFDSVFLSPGVVPNLFVGCVFRRVRAFPRLIKVLHQNPLILLVCCLPLARSEIPHSEPNLPETPEINNYTLQKNGLNRWTGCRARGRVFCYLAPRVNLRGHRLSPHLLQGCCVRYDCKTFGQDRSANRFRFPNGSFVDYKSRTQLPKDHVQRVTNMMPR